MSRYLWAFLACSAVSCVARPRPAPVAPPSQFVVEEVPARAPISADPLFDPSKPPMDVPAAALAARGGDERFANESMGRWRHSIFQLSGTAESGISVTVPSVVLVKVVSLGNDDLTVSVLRNGAALAAAETRRGPEGRRIARARMEVSSPGDLVVRTTSRSPQSVTVELYVGVVERPPKR